MQPDRERRLAKDNQASVASALLELRRARLEVLPSDLFSDAAWDLLLELFLADANGARLTGAGVCRRANIPEPVMSRWLMHSTKVGLIIGDGKGQLDELLTLSANGLDKMEQLMGRARVLLRDVS
jgi:hypothetical protein